MKTKNVQEWLVNTDPGLLILSVLKNWAGLFNPLPNKPWSFENTVGKGEISRNEQFLLFPQCFLPILCHFDIKFKN